MGGGATEPSAKRGLLSVVPDARRAEVNIKKLPLISHKAAANRTDAVKVRAAQGRQARLLSFVGLGPLVRNLGALFLLGRQ